jgi:SET domain
MAKHILPPSIYIADTGTAKGRGAFAARAFAPDELVEACPVVPFDPGLRSVPSAIERIMFGWGYLIGNPGPQAIVLGYGSIYNHDNPANMRYEAKSETQELHFIAVREIRADEELTVNYNAHGGGAQWDDDAWFKRMRVEPITGEQPDEQPEV